MIERLFRKLGVLVVKRRAGVLIAVSALVVASLYGATQISLATGTDTFLSAGSESYRDFERFNEHFGSSVIVVMVTGADITQLLKPDNLEALEYVEVRMSENENVLSAMGPAFYVKQAVAAYSGTAAVPIDPNVVPLVALDPVTGQIRPELSSVLPDHNHALIPVVLQGMYYTDDEVKKLIAETQEAVAEAGFVDVEPVVTGVPVLMSQIEDSMAKSMPPMLVVAGLLMFLILTLIFRVRGFFAWRWLPLGVVGIGIIYAFGAAGFLSIPITAVSISSFPILIGLGIDYSIQLHNRYDEEVTKGKTFMAAIRLSLTRVGPSIGIALIAVCISFAAMLFSPVPMIQDFGLMLLVGVVACYLVAIMLLPAVLYWRGRYSGRPAAPDWGRRETMSGADGFVEAWLRRLAPVVMKRPAIVISVAVALTIAGLAVDSRIQTETDEANMMSPDVAAMRDYQTLKGVMFGEAALNVPVNVLVEADDVSQPEILAWMLEFGSRIRTDLGDSVCSTNSIADLALQTNGGELPQDCEHVKQCLGGIPAPLTRNLVSEDYTAANIVVGLQGSFEQDEIEQLRTIRAQLISHASDHPEEVKVAVTGSRLLAVEMFDALANGRQRMTIIGVGAILVALVLLFRFSVAKALVAALPIALIVGWSSGLMYVLGIKYTFLTVTLGALILGIGVEYTILMLRRYYEERGNGLAAAEAMTASMTKIGRAILASGLTTIGGFAALLAATDFVILRDFGIMTVLAISLALASTLLILPALVVGVDSWQERRRL